MNEQNKQTELSECIKRDLWSLSEFANLCCGFTPGCGKSDDEAILVNQATDRINEAALIGAIPFIDPDDTQDSANRLYNVNRYFKPCDVIEWAGKNFYTFPYSANDLPDETKPIDPRKETTLNCLIAVLAGKLGYSPDKTDTVGKVHALLEGEGVPMDKKTIRANIKAAFSSLNERRE